MRKKQHLVTYILFIYIYFFLYKFVTKYKSGNIYIYYI